MIYLQKHLHPSVKIPENVLRSLNAFAKMIAMGGIEREDAVASLVEAAVKGGCKAPERNLRTDFMIALNGEVVGWEMKRSKAPWQIKKAIEPAIAAWAAPGVILQVASDTNESLGGPLLWHELRQIVGEELTWFIRRMRRTAGRRV